jgi:hypothetical protein
VRQHAAPLGRYQPICSRLTGLLLERRENPRGQIRRAAAIHQLEQLVQINPILAREPLGQITGKSGASQALHPPPLPPRPIASRALWRLVTDTHRHPVSLGAADLERRQQHQHERRRGDKTMSPDERDREMLLGRQAALGDRPAGGAGRGSRLAAL